MRLRVSRLCVFFVRNGQLVCDDPLRHKQLALRPEAWALLGRYARWREAEEAERSLVGQLLAARILIAEDSPEHRREDALGPWADWGTAATYFHLATRTHDADEFLTAAEDTSRLRLKSADEPTPYKHYDRGSIPLPKPSPLAMGLSESLRLRRTVRHFDAAGAASLEQLGTLLHWTAGIRYRVQIPGFGVSLLKSNPSGGARHPVEIYPIVRNVDGIGPGIYHYNADDHSLARVGDPADIAHLCGGQAFADNASALLAYTAMLERSAWKYRMSRTYRTLFMDLGHVSQTAYLVATALGLGAFFTAAIRDEFLEEILGIDWTREIPIGITGIGVISPAEALRQQRMLDGEPATFSYPKDDWDGLGGRE